jgi:predicted alpha/beta-hydrolase family hydrolase
MGLDSPQALRIAIDADTAVSALMQMPPDARALYVFAHGAGAGMTHSFMSAFADGLAQRGIATLRYQFPSMEKGARRPDPPAVAHGAVRAAVGAAAAAAPGRPLFAGGKSFGGRMTSQAQATTPLANVRGLVFVGFPLHPAGKPGTERANHLQQVALPMLFLQGTQDALADVTLLRPIVDRLGERATLALFADADHAFHVPARSGRRDADVRNEMLDATAGWIDRLVA